MLMPLFFAAATVLAPPAPSMALGQKLAPGHLANLRGGADTVSNSMSLSGTVSANSATQVLTGANAINGGAFANAAGLPVVIQNSGANVLIQNATIINLQLQ